MRKFVLALLPAIHSILDAQTDVRDVLLQDVRSIQNGLAALTGPAREAAEALLFETLARHLFAAPLDQIADFMADLQLVRGHVCRVVEAREREAPESPVCAGLRAVVEAEAVESEPVEPEHVDTVVIDETVSLDPSQVVARLRAYLYSTEADDAHGDPLTQVRQLPGFDGEFWALVRQTFRRERWEAFGFDAAEQEKWQRSGVRLGQAELLRTLGYEPPALGWHLAEQDRRRLSVVLERILPTTMTVGELFAFNLPRQVLLEVLTHATPGAA